MPLLSGKLRSSRSSNQKTAWASHTGRTRLQRRRRRSARRRRPPAASPFRDRRSPRPLGPLASARLGAAPRRAQAVLPRAQATSIRKRDLPSSSLPSPDRTVLGGRAFVNPQQRARPTLGAPSPEGLLPQESPTDGSLETRTYRFLTRRHAPSVPLGLKTCSRPRPLVPADSGHSGPNESSRTRHVCSASSTPGVRRAPRGNPFANARREVRERVPRQNALLATRPYRVREP